jgi:hypothetical protein
VRRRLTDAVTALAAQTFPPSRRSDGRVVRDCARDAIDAAGLRAMVREPLSVAGAGLRVRLGVSAREVRRAPWRGALALLVLPLAAVSMCVWTFGFVPRYDHWPLGVGWSLLLGGSLVAVVGAALEARWVVLLGAGATFVAAAAPYLGYGTEAALADTATFFPATSVDLGAASLIPTLLLAGAAFTLPRRPSRSLRRALDRLVLAALPTVVALIHLLPVEPPQRQIGLGYEAPPKGGRLPEPEVFFSPPYPFPELVASRPLIGALGIALLVAALLSWRTARTRPEPALATALVLVAVAHPVAWTIHGYKVWPAILLPLGVAVALTLRAAHGRPLVTASSPR